MMYDTNRNRPPVWELIAIIALTMLALLLIGCRVKRVQVVERVRDSVRTEVRYRTEYKRDTITLEIPAQRSEARVRDSVSLLETDYAVSRASITSDGLLHHSLSNKSGSRPQAVNTPVHYRDSIVYRDRDRVRTEVKMIPYPLSKWQRWQMRGFWIAISVLGLWLGWRFRRLWIPVVMRILRL